MLTLADLSLLALLFLIWNSVTFSLLFDGKRFIYLDVSPHMNELTKFKIVLNSNPDDVTIEHLTRVWPR